MASRESSGEAALSSPGLIGLSWHHIPTGTSRFIQYAQQAQKGHTWSPGHRYLALLERHSGRCYVGVYDSETLVRHFPVSTEATGVSWSPCGKRIAIWDWKVTYAISFYTPVGSAIGSFKPTDAVLGAVRPCPTANRIAFTTGTPNLYLWDKLGVEAVRIPGDMTAVDVQWAPDGHTASVSDRQVFCLVYEEVADESSAFEGETWEEVE
ncbi:hypothetical protein Q8F55_008831 [Vanrija albida]|uniref:Anaphase-promoting complex subunit 4 WD40 domain-containing protein n=1 Tax=Vanrija albida TaxID=181172 RepID=A0ABR3PRY8_9TREE